MTLLVSFLNWNIHFTEHTKSESPTFAWTPWWCLRSEHTGSLQIRHVGVHRLFDKTGAYPLQAEPLKVAEFLMQTVPQGIKSSTILSKASHISAIHRLSSLDDPTNIPRSESLGEKSTDNWAPDLIRLTQSPKHCSQECLPLAVIIFTDREIADCCGLHTTRWEDVQSCLLCVLKILNSWRTVGQQYCFTKAKPINKEMEIGYTSQSRKRMHSISGYQLQKSTKCWFFEGLGHRAK